MKKVILLMIIVMISFVFADDYDMQTLVSGRLEHGGYGGPVVKFSEINGGFGVFVGGHGGWIINDRLVIGGGGYGLANDVSLGKNDIFNKSQYINFGYGGFELGYILSSNSLFHLDFNTLVGAGGVGYRHSVFDEDWDEWEECDCEEDYDDYDKPVFVVEPTMNLMVNVSKHVRLGIGASYRYVAGLKDMDISNDDLTGISASINIKFGSF